MYLNELKTLCKDYNITMKRQTCFFSNRAPIMFRKICNFNNINYEYWYSDFETLKSDLENSSNHSEYTYQLHFRYNTQDIIYYYFFSALNNTSYTDDSYVSLTERMYNNNSIKNNILPELDKSDSFDIVLKINAMDKEYLKSFASRFNQTLDDSIEEDELVNIRTFVTNVYYSCFIYIKEGQYNNVKLFKLAGDSIVISDVIYSKKFTDIDIVSLVDIIPSIGKVNLHDFLSPNN